MKGSVRLESFSNGKRIYLPVFYKMSLLIALSPIIININCVNLCVFMMASYCVLNHYNVTRKISKIIEMWSRLLLNECSIYKLSAVVMMQIFLAAL